MRAPLIENLDPETLATIGLASLAAEAAKRLPPHGVFKWWGRRFSVLSRAVLASLILDRGEESVLSAVLQGDPPECLRERARGVLVLDPFSGAGTIPLEAGYLGFNSVGLDISGSAVKVAEATITIVSRGCGATVECLVSALRGALRRTGPLWRVGEETVIHTFLVRCRGDTCMVPSLLTSRRRREGRECLVITESGTSLVRGGECKRYTPVHPLIEAPAARLAWASPGALSYAVELAGPRGRRFVSFTDPEWTSLAVILESTARQALAWRRDRCTPLPPRGEPARLRRSGLRCWEHLFTPRQLASLWAFVEEARARGCDALSRVIAASVSRSASMLAIYYQPAGKVNPGLVIKGYWLPQYPVELNPLGSRPSKHGPPLPMGRGGLASAIRSAWRACISRGLPDTARIELRRGDATDPGVYPALVDHVVTDPPYPGMQDYSGLSMIYDYWLGYPSTALPGRDKTSTIIEMLRAVRSRVRRGGYVILIMGAGMNHLNRLASIVDEAASLYGLRRVYWLPGESPGGLGRSRVRGVFLVVARSGAAHRRDALEPLRWTGRIAEKVNSLLGKPVVDPRLEEERALTLAGLLGRAHILPSPGESTPRARGLWV